MTDFKYSTLFGDSLESKTGTIDTDATLGGKNVMIYFSAHWCPPCRGFTPKLCEFYTNFKKVNSDFELVFVSSDRDEAAFKEYYGEMPFLALPYANRDAKAALSKKFKVNGIPSLVVVGSDGKTITRDGRTNVMEDPKGEKFPWKPPSFEDVFKGELEGKNGKLDASDLVDKYLMIYFSAHWCPPCRGFTPELVKVYNKMKESRDDFELVFASSDRDEKSFNEYFGEMPWTAIPFSNRDAKNELSKMFEVEGIPSLVVLGPEVDGKREIITTSARGSASMDNIADFPWRPKPYAELSATVECNGSDINDSPAIIVLCEAADDEEQKEIKEAVQKVAEKQPEETGLLFFYATGSAGPVPRVRQLCNVPESKYETVMIKLDIPDDGGYYVSECNDFTVENIEKFIAAPGERKQLG
mmetsp:Transcript_5893/g.11817  ORF Transcript_5893/g.11817 Transcript_5893/m.11817 type:complete len:413 (+) Transcript_5893:46-1284(+)|eukprot:CAMPEP_0118645314 /NCGR_PEP_ID=MMETSP0785-20121206/7432_1 /TAXON_ID=91992 /ORGANISM="Bolidomonas pacifica, Strain CCMP 1866" /LENGTH=412 /DNA_ID=CAMNT_0006537183 /DNA_START=49 /DNA_END=1287 /DNA_ORIENTATION=-